MQDLFIYFYYILSQVKSITTTSQGPLESSCPYSPPINKDWLHTWYVSGSVQDVNSVVHLFDIPPNSNWPLHSRGDFPSHFNSSTAPTSCCNLVFFPLTGRTLKTFNFNTILGNCYSSFQIAVVFTLNKLMNLINTSTLIPSFSQPFIIFCIISLSFSNWTLWLIMGLAIFSTLEIIRILFCFALILFSFISYPFCQLPCVFPKSS